MNKKDFVSGIAEKLHIEKWILVAVFFALYDIVMINLAYFLALWLRFDMHFSEIPDYYLSAYIKFIPIFTVFSITVFFLMHLYHALWRFASTVEFERVFIASLISGGFHALFITLLFRRMPISYYIFGYGFELVFLMIDRFMYRFVLFQRRRLYGTKEPGNAVMIIGAGEAGQSILKEIRDIPGSGYEVKCFIDDDSNKQNRYVGNVPIAGGRNDILACVEKYGIKTILIAIPSASASVRREIANICQETDCDIKILPGVLELISGKATLSSMRNVSMEDLLGREEVKVDPEGIRNHLTGKVILVTGVGSIGSELCRQIAGYAPKQLVLLDVYENNAFDIQNELKRSFPALDLVTLIGSVRDSRRMNAIFEQYHPDIVFHAAAHKHVPLMEDSPEEAVKNNVIGTYKTAYAAVRNHCPRFVLISTDKAVNPTNYMGASKRICEMVIQMMDACIKSKQVGRIPEIFTHFDENYGENPELPSDACTEFVAVRFGNVLGSNGSVVPFFRKQIQEGGPVTVTHPDIIRYFMTIPEAVSLVLQASVYAKGGEIFVLDMGEPVKIDTLARNLIRLSGYIPDEDIKIVYTGLRPGEKLYEEKLMAEEGLEMTDNRLIFIGKPVVFDHDIFIKELKQLLTLSYQDVPAMKALMRSMVAWKGKEE